MKNIFMINISLNACYITMVSNKKSSFGKYQINKLGVK